MSPVSQSSVTLTSAAVEGIRSDSQFAWCTKFKGSGDCTSCISIYNLSIIIQLGIQVPEEIGRLPLQTWRALPLTLVLGIEDWKSGEKKQKHEVKSSFRKQHSINCYKWNSFANWSQSEIYMNISKNKYLENFLHVNFTVCSPMAIYPVYSMTDMCTYTLLINGTSTENSIHTSIQCLAITKRFYGLGLLRTGFKYLTFYMPGQCFNWLHYQSGIK